MPRLSSQPSAFADRIQRLLAERQLHTDALARIEQTLSEIGRILGQPVGRPAGRPVGRPAGQPKAAAGRTKGRRKRGSYSVTAEESILGFVKEEGNPTTQEIKKHWAAEGRGGSADNELSRMVKNRKLKRMSIPGQRGSRYALP